MAWILGALGCAYMLGWAFAFDGYPEFLIEWCREYEPYKSLAWILLPLARGFDLVNKLFKFTMILGLIHGAFWVLLTS